MRQRKQLELTSLNQFSGLWDIGLSPVVWYLALWGFRAGKILTGSVSLIKEVVGSVGSGLRGLHRKGKLSTLTCRC